MRYVALAVVLASAGCGGSTTGTEALARCLKTHGWKLEHSSTAKLVATRSVAGATYTLVYQPPGGPTIEAEGADVPKSDPLPSCYRQAVRALG